MKKKQKARHRTDFEADLWLETRDFFWPNGKTAFLVIIRRNVSF